MAAATSMRRRRAADLKHHKELTDAIDDGITQHCVHSVSQPLSGGNEEPSNCDDGDKNIALANPTGSVGQ